MTSFELEVKNAFDALAERYHMKCESAADAVIYKNETVSLALGYDSKRTYEIQVALGRVSDKGARERLVGLELILKDKGVEDAAWVSGLQVVDGKDIRPVLFRLAALLGAHGSEFLEGRPEAYARAAGIMADGREQYALRQRLLSARAEADRAWDRRDYVKVVDSLEPLEAHLSSAEKLRLGIARDRSVKGSP